jgi:hypothetical protein
MPGQPTAASELRRGVDAYNLMVGALSSTALALVTWLATVAGLAPDALGQGAVVQALAVALALFVLLTGLHTAAHTYFGWRFDRGIRAAAAGDHARAVRLLAPVARAGMGHYDLDGSAHGALACSREVLKRSSIDQDAGS